MTEEKEIYQGVFNEFPLEVQEFLLKEIQEGFAWSSQQAVLAVGTPQVEMCAYLQGEKCLAFVLYQLLFEDVQLFLVYVGEEFRHRGLAYQMLTELEVSWRQAEVERLILEVRPSNQAALTLYDKLGFYEIGRRKNYYRQPTEDAIVLEKDLKEVEEWL